MSTSISESLPARKFKQAAMAKPEAKKEAPKGKSAGGKGASEEGSEKRIRQAVYDIRYRARREDIDLKAAFAQYMSNSSLSQAERTAVREKLFGKKGGVSEKFINGADELAVDGVANALYKVFVEKKEEDKEIELAYLQQLDEEPAQKYKVRVTDTNGKSYVRFADRAKITELRQNPNIKSVEMTEHGDAYEGERRKGRMTAKAKAGKKLDPVGKEDADVDNDGDVDKSDKYILNRRKKIGQAIRTRAEAYLADGTISTEPKNPTKVTGKGVDNYSSGAVKVNPDDGSKSVKESVFSEAQIKMIKMYDDKRKKEEEELSKKDKVSSMITKDSIKKDDEKEEERPDMRSKYAMINVIKNKLRAAGQRDPMVMAVDACEEKIDEKKKIDYSEYPELVAQGRGGKTANVDVEPAALKTYRNVRSTLSLLPSAGKRLLGDKDAFKKHEKAERQRYKNPKGLERIATGLADKLTGDKYDFDRRGSSKKKIKEQTTVTNDGSKLSDKHVPGGPNSQYNADGTKKTKKTKKTEDKYNPYGENATANPENMSATSGS